MVSELRHNYYLIIRSLLRYLPAKLLVVLCSFLITPIFVHVLDVKEVSIFLVSLQLLNLFCTFSTDWIAKAILRFYVKYKIENRLEDFVSSISAISAITYLIILALFFILKNVVYTNLAVNNIIFAIVILLIIPTGLRQILYQIVRIKNKAGLYTLSIIFYQTIFIAGFLLLVTQIPNALSVILAMLLAMIAVDIYLIKSLTTQYTIGHPNKEITLNILKYACPLIITNVTYWLLLRTPLLIFQNKQDFLYSASLSISVTIMGYIITTFAGLFLFVTFPVFVKDYELNKNIKKHFTNLIQLYLYLLLPLVSTCCLFSNEITQLLLPSEYNLVAKILPFLSIMYFLHELLKIINIKYHLRNKTYLEMGVNASIIISIICLIPFLIEKYSIFGALWGILFAEILLFIANLSIKIKDIDYINYPKIIKTLLFILLITSISYIFVTQIELPHDKIFILAKLLFFLVFTYFINYCMRKKILY